MKVRSLAVDGFGALRGRTFEIAEGVVVVCGRNERGKSSFRAAVRTLLFGFSPASFDKHPLAAASALQGDDALAVDEITTRVGGTLAPDEPDAPRWIVQRAFAPHAVQRTHREGEEPPALTRGNSPVPGLEPVTAALYDATFSIDAGDVRATQRVHAGIERLLLGDDAAPHGASITSLRGELEAQRAKLWRSSRRSASTRVAALDADIARAAREARDARRVERDLLDLEQEALERRDALARRLTAHGALEDELAKLRLVERVARLVRSGEALEGVDVDAMSEVDLEAPGPLLAELEDAEAALEEPRDRLTRPLPYFDEVDRRALESGPTIDGLARVERELESGAREAEAALVRAGDCRRAAQDVERSLFLEKGGGSLDAGGRLDAGRLRAVQVEAERWSEALAPGADAPGASPSGAWTNGGMHPGTVAATTGALGLVAGGVALALDQSWLSAAAAVALPLAAVAAVSGRPGRARSRADGTSSDERGPGHEPPDALVRALVAIGVDVELARSPDHVRAIVERLQRCASLRDEAAELAVRAEGLRATVEGVRSGWRALAERLGVALERAPDGGGARGARLQGALDDTADRLRERLAEARRRAEIARLDAMERKRARREVERAEARLAAATARFDGLREGLRRAVPGEAALERAYERATRALAERERQRGALREFALDPAWHAALEDPRFTRARRDGSLDLAELRAAEARTLASHDAIEGEREAIVRLEERLGRERPERTPSEVDSELEALQRERRATLDEHDRLALMVAVLDAGERDHREAHQPRVLARASAWMDAITRGRYPRIEYEGGGGAGLRIARAGTPAGTPVGAGHSRGVREQAHLCIRLAAAEQLDEAGESLPLLLDEALVHWDEERRAALYPVLARFRGRRQVFLFTCHEALADEAVAALEAQRIDL